MADYGYINLIMSNQYSFVELSDEPSSFDEFKEDKILFRKVKGRSGLGIEGIRCGASKKKKGGMYAVQTDDYWISVFPVTQKQWTDVCGDFESDYEPRDQTLGETLPVVFVSYNRIKENKDSFIKKFQEKLTGYTVDLPTEMQWEIACRGGHDGNENDFYWESDSDTESEVESEASSYAWFKQDLPVESDSSDSETWGRSDYPTIHEVGSKSPNSLGLYDMSGNVFEWCRDWYGTLPSTTRSDPPIEDYTGAPTGSEKVLKGGSWNVDLEYCSSYYRGHLLPNRSGIIVGFRIVLRKI